MTNIILESICEFRLQYSGYRLFQERCWIMCVLLSIRDTVDCFVKLTVSLIRYKHNHSCYDDLF